MKFKVGQEVTIRRNLGERNGYDEFEYYYGGTIKNVPLGTKGIIYQMNNNSIHLILKNRSRRAWDVHPDEINISEEQIKAGKEIEERLQARVDSLLENGLLGESKEPFEDRLVTKREQKKFEPKFNAREEFAVWIREEFPELEKYAKNRKKYKALIERKEEAMEGAKKAYAHANDTSQACVFSKFRGLFCFLESEENIGRFAYRLENFVKYIEHVSANLYDGGIRHYGTSIFLSNWEEVLRRVENEI